jgi:hypothetical protein
MASSSSSPTVRRSSRPKQKVTTIYDTAAIELEEKERIKEIEEGEENEIGSDDSSE